MRGDLLSPLHEPGGGLTAGASQSLDPSLYKLLITGHCLPLSLSFSFTCPGICACQSSQGYTLLSPETSLPLATYHLLQGGKEGKEVLLGNGEERQISDFFLFPRLICDPQTSSSFSRWAESGWDGCEGLRGRGDRKVGRETAESVTRRGRGESGEFTPLFGDHEPYGLVSVFPA